MFALINFNVLLLFQEAQGGNDFYNTYLNYPGFEAWKFLNLFIFVGAIVYLLKKPLGTAFKTKRETIRQELVRAKQERDAALSKLAEVETRFQNLQAETAAIQAQSQREAEAEAGRILEQTRHDVEKLRENARREIEAAGAQAKRELKRFSANETVRIAEEMLRGKMDNAESSRLISNSIAELGAAKNNGGLN